MDEQTTVTSVEPTPRPKNPKRQAQGKRLAAISQAAKARKRQQRELAEQASLQANELAEQASLQDEPASWSVVTIALVTTSVLLTSAWLLHKERSEPTSTPVSSEPKTREERNVSAYTPSSSNQEKSYPKSPFASNKR